MYVCKSPIKFSTYTFPYVTSLLTIRLAYDLFHLFPLFLLKHEIKERKAQSKIYYISRTRLQGLNTKQANKKKGSN